MDSPTEYIFLQSKTNNANIRMSHTLFVPPLMLSCTIPRDIACLLFSGNVQDLTVND